MSSDRIARHLEAVQAATEQRDSLALDLGEHLSVFPGMDGVLVDDQAKEQMGRVMLQALETLQQSQAARVRAEEEAERLKAEAEAENERIRQEELERQEAERDKSSEDDIAARETAAYEEPVE